MTLLAVLFAFQLQAETDLPACSAAHLELATRSSFTVCHHSARKVPVWTAYTLTPSQVDQPAGARSSRFREDASLHTPGASDADYVHSGYHRGHLVPARDTGSPDTFLLSNAAPTTPSLNLGRMRQLENLIRTLAASSDSVTVITGTLFESPTLETIGPRQVAVPTHFFKAVLIERNGRHHVLAAVLPNSERITDPLISFLTTIDEVERRTNLDLFSSLPDDEEATLEATSPTRESAFFSVHQRP